MDSLVINVQDAIASRSYRLACLDHDALLHLVRSRQRNFTVRVSTIGRSRPPLWDRGSDDEEVTRADMVTLYSSPVER
jgi:hypothetical protein